jgi:eukaryotic-like serine/threonine-protein kinase
VTAKRSRPPDAKSTQVRSDNQQMTDGPTRPQVDAAEDTILAASEAGPAPAAGNRAAERYELRDQLGKGGMGEVLRATDRQLGRDVAIKRLHAAIATGEAEVRFLREARIQGQLDHPAIPPVHEMARDAEGRPFFVMKRLSGDGLDAILRKLVARDRAAVAGFPRPRLLRAFVDVCMAMEFAHAKGIVHRDLKPANVMLGDYGEVYVLDWGIARMLGEDQETPLPRARIEEAATSAGTMMGTPGYMSPDQIEDARVGPPADVYALGCILFEVLAGAPLHPRGEAGIASALEGAADARASRRAPDREVPPELDALCVRATAYQPEARPTARELGDEVQRFLDGDRDLALRRGLAGEHLARARAALAAADDEAGRATAMREAGRALALDPTATAAADLVGRLMLEPPTDTPRQVIDELEAADRASMQSQGRLAALALLGMLAFVPVMLWSGVRDWRYVALYVAFIAVTATAAYGLTRRGDIDRNIYYVLGINALLTALLSRMFTPFLIAPGVATATVTVFAAHPRGARTSIAWAVLALAVLGPWTLELAGVWGPTMWAAAGSLVLESPAIAIRSPHTEVALALAFLVLLAVAGAIARSIARGKRESQRDMMVQAWHLKQLMPTSAAP